MSIKIFKFGGASVKDASAVRNLAAIISSNTSESLVVVVSAMGKTTNALEKVVAAMHTEKKFPTADMENVINYHYNIIDNLFFGNDRIDVKVEADVVFNELRTIVEHGATENFDLDYDQIVSFGEIISTLIIARYLQILNINCEWADARKLVTTNGLHREAIVLWDETKNKIQDRAKTIFNQGKIMVTQGFIGSDLQGITTTLGREGSDFTGAIFAWSLDAASLTIWKDVPGFLNADPKIFSNTTKIDRISYGETIELTYFGATIIHPKTLKPLNDKQIPLLVKSFLNPDSEGSIIHTDGAYDYSVPSFIVKDNQLLMSMSTRDHSFMSEEHLARIFTRLAEYHIKVNMMQISALSFSICIDDNKHRYSKLIESLKTDYKIKYNQNLQLLTIRHYRQKDITDCTANKTILLEQRNRTTIQLVLDKNDEYQ